MSRILAADDAPALRHLLRHCLEQAGHEVIVASNGAEALAILDSGRPIDALVTDHAMPGASGVEVITAARRRDPSLACVIVTAHDDLDVAASAMSHGADGYIPKPFRPEHLIAVVGQALDRRRLALEELHGSPRVSTLPLAVQGVAAHLAARIGQRLGLAPGCVEAAALGAALRDIGRGAVPERLTLAAQEIPGAAERLQRNHPLVGAAMLDGVEPWASARDAVLHHHERFDGTGYPDGLAGEEIPLIARIAATVDAALELRALHSAGSTSAAAVSSALRALAGSQLDPVCVEALAAVLEESETVLELPGTPVG